MIRREFLKNAGSLTIGFTMGRPLIGTAGDASTFVEDELPQSLQRNPAINAWLRLKADGRLEVLTGKMELGQGIKTAIAQVAAEELDLRMDQVDVSLAATATTPDEGYTAGSGSMDNSAMSVRYAAAAARQKLITLAVAALKTPENKLIISEGIIRSTLNKQQISFSKLLAGKQITDKVTLPVKLKVKNKYKLVSKAIPRDDIKLMITGQPVYVQDLRFPDMLHARIIRPPNYAAKLIRFNEAGLRLQFPDLVKIVIDGSFVGVITMNEYQAVQIQAVGQNFCEWESVEPIIPGSFTSMKEYIRTLPAKKQEVKKLGQPDAARMSGSSVYSASYYKPYMMHGSIGPSCSVAIYKNNRLQLWSHSQGVFPLRESLSPLLGIPVENIDITGVPGSGCYGHNGADDVTAEAAILAIANPGKHIRLQWSREDEHAWEPYGSAMLMDVSARLDEQGKITDWHCNLWSDTHGTRPGGKPENLLPARYTRKNYSDKPGGYSGGAYRNADPYYEIPNQQVDINFFDGPLRVSALRSLGAYGNIFAIECFMDELAEKTGRDPFEFRLMHLKDERARAVLIKLRELIAGQDKNSHQVNLFNATSALSPLPVRTAVSQFPAGKTINENPATKPEARYGLGIAFSRYKNSAAYCAVAAEVSYIEKGTQFIIHKMYSVIDAGESINIDGVINQTEGGMIQAASWTLQEEVKFDHQRIHSVDWKTYPIFRFSQAPETEVVVINNPAEGPLGAGEAAQGPAGAALANAVYKASGVRYRDLPIISLPLPKE